MVTIIGSCISCDMMTLPVISTTPEYKKNYVSAVCAPWQFDARSGSAMREQTLAN